MPRTLIEIDRSSDEPLYRQVRRAIEHGIAIGTFDPARRLPSSRELAVELGVSRNTINLAYQELVAEGYVESRERSGLFVNGEMRPHCAVEARDTESRIDWAGRVRRFPDAEVAHIEKRTDWASYPYPFLAGQVDITAFPARSWTRCLRDALYRPHVFHSLQDSVGSDDPMLVEMVCRQLLTTRGIEADPDEVLITVGSQQGLDLLGRVLLGPDQVVAIENPGYLDARHIFLRTGARVTGIDVDSRGLQPPESLDGIDLLYLTPSHQHPTNATLSIGRRRQLLAQAAASGTVVVEDDYDSEFRYQGSPTPALKALDNTGDAVYLGTFSKFLSPGLRLGYLVGPRELVRALREARRYVLRHPPGQLQRALALLIESGEYHRSLRRYRTKLMRKWTATTAAVTEYLPWTQGPYPPGGVSLWMSGPSELDCRVLVERAEELGVLIEPGDIFFLGDDPPRNHFRIGFSATPPSAIDPGIRLLGDLCRELLDS
ncbi:PLP-dependent aminotransferase family protein [Amycolatopsis sp. AA4]|uniref:MocR-like pyridoxine biosynthesis transcription factor PdxR n=1 Tax=Actinomycetes TaxID=1760 RepID=UPI0001B55043|nr:MULTISPECIES: PLP-dependent aminotransferase family protein [Actinomycetes]ATY12077.1 PLP-dependent aminotransferase family protein [Amycolatopsis sp. AA4]EFL07788.1 GntR family transcriptional regulator [Streptomyces sp. AA4]